MSSNQGLNSLQRFSRYGVTPYRNRGTPVCAVGSCCFCPKNQPRIPLYLIKLLLSMGFRVFLPKNLFFRLKSHAAQCRGSQTSRKIQKIRCARDICAPQNRMYDMPCRCHKSTNSRDHQKAFYALCAFFVAVGGQPASFMEDRCSVIATHSTKHNRHHIGDRHIKGTRCGTG